MGFKWEPTLSDLYFRQINLATIRKVNWRNKPWETMLSSHGEPVWGEVKIKGRLNRKDNQGKNGIWYISDTMGACEEGDMAKIPARSPARMIGFKVRPPNETQNTGGQTNISLRSKESGRKTVSSLNILSSRYPWMNPPADIFHCELGFGP